MKKILLTSLITLLVFSTACGQASEPEPEPVANDGIQVHGHWTVTVTNPDGTVDAVHEFENSMSGYGSDLLTALLAGEAAIDSWEIVLVLAESTQVLVCQENPGGSLPGGSRINAVPSRNTSVDGSPLMLSANCTVQTAESSQDLVAVRTWVTLDTSVDMVAQQGSTLTNVVVNNDTGAFTSRSIAMSLINDQMLSFNVVISFS